MKLSIHIPVHLPVHLEMRLRERAQEVGVTPSRLIQSLVEEHLDGTPRPLSVKFLALAGSWEDDRSTEEIIRDIKDPWAEPHRPELR